MARLIDTGWTASDGTDCRITISYDAGSSPYWDRAYGCYMPGDPSDVEIVEIREDVKGGALRPDLLEEAQKCLDEIADGALEAADDRDRGLEEDRWDLEREDRAFGGRL